MARHHVAQINIARLRAPVDDPEIADFVEALEPINALAEESPGFVWRLQTDDGDATGIQAYEDEQVIINLTVWESIDDLHGYVYRSGHTDFMRRRSEWFQRMGEAYVCLWWVPAGTQPSIEDGVARLDQLQADGPAPEAFTFRRQFAPPQEPKRP
jgi:hypothetical protein